LDETVTRLRARLLHEDYGMRIARLGNDALAASRLSDCYRAAFFFI
jgi:hypothetical protein